MSGGVRQRFHRLARRGFARRRILPVVVLVGLLGAGWALAEALDASDRDLVPGWIAIFLAVAFCIVWFGALAMSWLRLFPGTSDAHRLLSAAWLSQLAKYLPIGGLAQAGTQIGLGRDRHTGAMTAAVVFPIWMLMTLLGAATVGVFLVADSSAPTLARVVGALGVVSLPLLWRPWICRALLLARRLVSRIPGPEAVPSQPALLRSYAWSVTMVAVWGIALAVLVRDLNGDANPVSVIGAYAIAWAVGLLVVPIPAGAGVREAVLIAILGPSLGVDVVLAAAIVHRVVTILTEILVVGADQLLTMGWRRRNADQG